MQQNRGAPELEERIKPEDGIQLRFGDGKATVATGIKAVLHIRKSKLEADGKIYSISPVGTSRAKAASARGERSREAPNSPTSFSTWTIRTVRRSASTSFRWRMKAAKARGKHLGRPRTPATVVARIEELAKTTDLSVRDIHRSIGAKTGRGVVGDIVKRVRHSLTAH